LTSFGVNLVTLGPGACRRCALATRWKTSFVYMLEGELCW